MDQGHIQKNDMPNASYTGSQALQTDTILEYVRRISWSAVLAGALIAIVVQICLSLLGIGIGLSTIDPKTEANPVSGLGVGSAVWYFLSSLLSLFAGGWVAGRLSPGTRRFEGIIHGLLTWSIVTFITLYFLTSTIGSLIGGAGRLAAGTVRTVGNVAGSGIAAAAPAIGDQLKDNGVDLTSIKQQAKTLLSQTGKPALQPDNLSNEAANAVTGNPQYTSNNPNSSTGSDADNATDNFFNNLVKDGKVVASNVDKDAMVNVIMARTGKSRVEANQLADSWISSARQASNKWQQTKQQAEVKARDIADKTAKVASTAAILTFFSLLLGAIVAGFSAMRGALTAADIRNLQTAPVSK